MMNIEDIKVGTLYRYEHLDEDGCIEDGGVYYIYELQRERGKIKYWKEVIITTYTEDDETGEIEYSTGVSGNIDTWHEDEVLWFLEESNEIKYDE